MSEGLVGAGVSARAASKLFTRLLGAPVTELGELIGDHVRSWRVQNLIRIQEHLECALQSRGVAPEKLRPLALSVGLRMLDQASCQSDSFLQERWANLMAAALCDVPDQEFSLDVMHIEMLNQMTRLDCKVLEYVCEYGVKCRDKGGIIISGLDPKRMDHKFSGGLAHISLEKLIILGALQRGIKTPLRTGNSVFGLEDYIAPTLVGINLYCASSNKTPVWAKTDESNADHGPGGSN